MVDVLCFIAAGWMINVQHAWFGPNMHLELSRLTQLSLGRFIVISTSANVPAVKNKFRVLPDFLDGV